MERVEVHRVIKIRFTDEGFPGKRTTSRQVLQPDILLLQMDLAPEEIARAFFERFREIGNVKMMDGLTLGCQ